MSILRYRLLGLMSGSSLDGLDLACCYFETARAEAPHSPNFHLLRWELEASACVPYSDEWIARLQALPKASAREYVVAHTDFGRYLGEQVNRFVRHLAATPDAVVSHGHTIFHLPEQQCTAQLGDGAALAASCNLPVISDCRSSDIALGGQGTPLAPLADRYLFPGFDAYLNLGGIANVSLTDSEGHWRAWDVGPANQILNRLAQLRGLPYDMDGKLARAGQALPALLEQLDAIPYFRQPAPKSLDNSWIADYIWPLYLNAAGSVEDKLHTACLHLRRQLQLDLPGLAPDARVFVSGGGALNRFLVEQLRTVFPGLALPPESVIQYKEAALMALVGLFRLEQVPNCLHTVTGAKASSINGALYAKPTLHG
jgi:anhydro-N-acetylmuramic acid kinase